MLPSFSVRRPFTIIVAVIAIVALGFTALTKMPTSLIPELNLPYVVVYTTYPGASPEQVEASVTDPVESALSTTSGLKSISSMSNESVSMVIMEFSDGVDMASALLQMRESLDLLADYMPDEVGTPNMMRINLDSLPVSIITVDLAGADRAEISKYVEEEIEPALESVDGVASVEASGLVERRMLVTIDTDKLKEKNDDLKSLMAMSGGGTGEDTLTVQLVAQVLAANNMSFPSGYAYDDSNKMQVRVGDKFQTPEELEDMLIIGMEEADIDIRLGDIADVEMVDNVDDSYTKVNGNDAVILQVSKQSEASTSTVAHAVGDKLDALEAANPDLNLVLLMDQGEYVDMVLDSIFENLIFGALLAILILFLFLRSWKLTGVIALSIPLSVVVALLLMYFTDISLNMISLSGIALGIGMLVDNSVVVIENIFRARSEGLDVKEAAVQGAKQVTGAILASTLTTCAVFIPFVFASGFVRQIFVDMALTICFSLVASLVVALTFVPMMCSGALKGAQTKQFKAFDKLVDKYEGWLDWSLKHKAIPLLVVGGLFSISMVIVANMGTQFFPETDTTQMTTSLTFDDEATFEEKVAQAEEVMGIIEGLDGVDSTGVAIAGSSSSSMSMMSSNGTTTIYTLLDEKHKTSSIDLAKEIDAKAAEKGIETSSSGSMMDVSSLTGSGVTVQLYGDDLDVLMEESKKIAADLEQMEGVGDVTGGFANPTGEYKIKVDKDKAMQQGLTVAQVYQQVATILAAPQSITTITNAGEDYPVYITTDEGDEKSIEDVKDIEFVSSTTGDTVKLSDIASVETSEGFMSISHSGGSRYVSITAETADDYNVGILGNDIDEYIEELELPEGCSIKTSGEADEIADALSDLLLVLVLAILLVYLVMVAQFQSLKYPFIIMATLPLCYTGAIFALIICGLDLSLIAVIGIVLLTGIVVNNGIIFVDFANQLRDEGLETHAALLQTGRLRIRPIFITAFTTIIAMFLMALGRGLGSQLSQPMAVCVIGGLLYATLLTLFIVPILYSIFDKGKGKRSREERKAKRLARRQKSIEAKESKGLLGEGDSEVDAGNDVEETYDFDASAPSESDIEQLEAEIDKLP